MLRAAAVSRLERILVQGFKLKASLGCSFETGSFQFETRNLKGVYFYLVETCYKTKCFQPRYGVRPRPEGHPDFHFPGRRTCQDTCAGPEQTDETAYVAGNVQSARENTAQTHAARALG